MAHNGWTNYATWRVNLEVFDGMDPREMGWQRLDKYDLGEVLKEYAVEVLEQQCAGAISLVFAYAMAFISEVNWREIAEAMLETYAEEEA